MIAAFRSQFLLLNRFRMWAIAGLVTIAFTVTSVALLITTAEPATQNRGDGISIETLTGPGGASAGVIWGFAFGFILILATFTSNVGNEFTRGTFRTALLHRPSRWTLIGGKMAALMAVTVALLAVGMVTGIITSRLIAPGQGIDTSEWFTADAIGETAGNFARLVGWAAGFALLGSVLAAVIRSTPIAIGAGVLWFGPIENVTGDGQAWAARWFPGQLLRAIVTPDAPDVVSTGTAAATPDAPDVVSTGTAAATLGAYAVVCAAIIAVVLQRRDVTS